MRKVSAMTQAGTVPQKLLDSREVAALAWRPFAGRAGLYDRVLWQDPAGRSYAGLLHMDPGTSVPPTCILAPLTTCGSCLGAARSTAGHWTAGPMCSSLPAGCTASRRSGGPAAWCSTCTFTRPRPTRCPDRRTGDPHT
jgi:hypothetical protein